MSDNQLVVLSKSFSVDIIKLCDAMKNRGKSSVKEKGSKKKFEFIF